MTSPTMTPFAGLVTTADRVVSPEQLAAYRAVARSASSVVADIPGGDMVASPIHPFVLAWTTFDQAVSILTGEARPRVIHLSQEIRQDRPLRAGESVRLELDVLGARRDPRGVRLSFCSTLIDDSGVPFAELLTGLLALEAQGPAPFGEPHRHPASTQTGSVEVCSGTIPADLPRRYAEVSEDANPIHLDATAAVAAGLPGVVAHGMSVVAVVAEEAIARYAEGDASRVTAVGTRFALPIVPGEPFEITFAPDAESGRVHFLCRTNTGLALKNGWIDVRS
jgi:acyl dehydratase